MVLTRLVQLAIYLGYFLILIYRIYLCAQLPLETSDLFRNLGFASHLGDLGGQNYHLKAEHFLPETWANLWSWVGYIYPPFTITFFYLLTKAQIGLFGAKLVFTILEAICAIIFHRKISPLAGLLLWASPISLWYTSHEGQFESLQTLLTVLAVFFAADRRHLLAGLFFGLGLQTKIFSVLLVPYFAWLWLHKERMEPKPFWLVFFGALASFVPFLEFYVAAPYLFLAPFRQDPGRYNPFAWNIFDSTVFGWNQPSLQILNAISSYSQIAILLVALLLGIRSWGQPLPALFFWCVQKTLRWAQFWYPLVLPGFIFCLKENRRIVYALLLLQYLQARPVLLLLGYYSGAMESPERLTWFKACFWAWRSSCLLPNAS